MTMSSGFTVKYVLAVLTIDPDTHRLVNGLFVHQNLKSCEQAAQRILAIDENAKWRCHEMTIEVKSRTVAVTFTGEGAP